VPGPAGKTYNVKFWATTSSGCTDAIIGRITTLAMGPTALRPAGDADLAENIEVGWPRAQGAGFAIVAPGGGDQASLTLFDITGRRVAMIRGRGGDELVWEGIDDRGVAVKAGVYLYRLVAGAHRRAGRWVVLR
jgi:hypothetical protein